jgi:hypothetical protein
MGKFVLYGQPAPGPTPGPAMKWFGYVATTAIIAGVIGLIASLIPGDVLKRVWWPGFVWVLPILAIVVLGVMIFTVGD